VHLQEVLVFGVAVVVPLDLPIKTTVHLFLQVLFALFGQEHQDNFHQQTQ
jgi:hypothetical protein